MNLDKFYSLRSEFVIIGLTGQVGSGCSEIAKKISSVNFISEVNPKSNRSLPKVDSIKNNICYNFLKYEGNWQPYKVINYKDVLLFHLIHQSNKVRNRVGSEIDLVIEEFMTIVCQNGTSNPEREEWENRIDKIGDQNFCNNMREFLKNNYKVFDDVASLGFEALNTCLHDQNKHQELYNIFFGDDYNQFCSKFYRIINVYNTVKRTRLTHDLANNLRAYGSVKNSESFSLENIYTIAETINRLIKAWRKHNPKAPCSKIVIDALKNSLELMYFKEKYSGFYMVATKRDEKQRHEYVRQAIFSNPDLDEITEDIKQCYIEEILNLDDKEYKCGDYKKGYFSSPDIENCIQKSDYHLYIDRSSESEYLDFDYQLLRLLALIAQPGIITPTGIERTMQVAYNAKLNSGCISRQVGAVVTDEKFSIKAIGWNDVPEGQIPCNLRSMVDLQNEQEPKMFSDYERGKFKEEAASKLPGNYHENLSGRNCSFCFKSFQNAIEGEKNQVHTRSLHAEENAMLQITKNGGQGLKGGNLFTTASPCELCSKKAYQLGIKKIYYIDPYPGIATTHILKGGSIENNPHLIMFQGAVGRVFHKLYEPFMAYKDEMGILTGIDPKPSMKLKIKSIIKDEKIQELLFDKMRGQTEDELEGFLNEAIRTKLALMPFDDK